MSAPMNPPMNVPVSAPVHAPMRILVVDDERLARVTTARQLAAAGFVVEAADGAFSAFELLAAAPFDVVLTDLRMPGMDGLAFADEVRRGHPGTDVILMTAYGTVETAVEAMRQGAADYLTKPFPFRELEARLHKLREVRAVRAELARLRAVHAEVPAHGIVGRSQPMLALLERIGRFATHPFPVLVTGETGTGKELVARALHAASPRANRRFVAVGCGTIPRDLAESELFGHEKGAFTGATRRRQGYFEEADGGTLLLDDVDDLPLELQVKLLRVLQEQRCARVGGHQELPVDVRLVATTKVDLRGQVEAGRFRDDLYYRLRGLELAVPPLRQRGDDVLLLAKTFLGQLAASQGRPPPRISVEAAQALGRHAWPGNVRELRRVMESACILCPGDVILPEHLPADLQRPPAADGQLFELRLGGRDSVPMADAVRGFEDALIDWALRAAGGQQARAAELLGLPRTTLQSKLARRGE